MIFVFPLERLIQARENKEYFVRRLLVCYFIALNEAFARYKVLQADVELPFPSHYSVQECINPAGDVAFSDRFCRRFWHVPPPACFASQERSTDTANDVS